MTEAEQRRRHWGRVPLFHPGERNRCPGCSHSNWHVGRVLAECGFCGLAMAIAAPGIEREAA
jgi:hypothetical protein